MRFPRRRTLGGALAAAAIIAAGVSAREELGAAAGPESGVVAEVYDGDTLTLVDGRKVRLVQINTPELGGGECYSRKARSHLLALAPRGAAVRLEADPLLETTDRYGRLLRYVLRNGMNVNLELVRRGAAAPYYYRGERGTIANELWAAVRVARAEKRGLWGACPGTPLQPERAIDTGTSGPPPRRDSPAGRATRVTSGCASRRPRLTSTAPTSRSRGSPGSPLSGPTRTASTETTTGSPASSLRRGMGTWVVTGANRGIGLELARQLHERGEAVVAACRTSSAVLEALGCAVVDGIDVARDEAGARIDTALDGSIDVLLHNAGILNRDGLADLDAEGVRAQFEANALGPLRLTRALRHRLGRGARVAFVSSKAGSIGDRPAGGMYGYRMSKAALNMAAANLAHELRPDGIAVIALHPGFVRTGMTDGAGNVAAPDAARGLIERIDELTLASTGRFLHADGTELPW